MNFGKLTDDDLQALREMPKRVCAPRVGSHATKAGHEKFQYELESDHYRFIVYTRQSLGDSGAYSVGILVENPHDGKRLLLARYDSADHNHGSLPGMCHIHYMTAKSQHGKNQESGRVVQGDYTDKEGALNALIKEYNIHGITEWL